MDLFSLVLACAVDGVEPSIVEAIVLLESDQQVLAIHDNTSGESHFPTDRMSAVQTANALLEQGHSLDLGLMQLNSRWREVYGASVEDCLTPCRNIGIGSDILGRYRLQCAQENPRLDPLRCALSRYHSGAEKGALEYADRVLSAALSRANEPTRKTSQTIFVWRSGPAKSATATQRERSLFVTREPPADDEQAPVKVPPVSTGPAP
jgi:soluble lytic murein transglycosylase-like protein